MVVELVVRKVCSWAGWWVGLLGVMKVERWADEWVGLMVATMVAESVVCSVQDWVVESVQGMAAQWDGR